MVGSSRPGTPYRELMRLSLALVTDDLARLRTFYRELFRTPWFGDDTYVEFRPGVDWLLAMKRSDVRPGAHVACEPIGPIKCVE